MQISRAAPITMIKLTDDKKAAIFKRLASSTLYDVGLEFGFDKHMKDGTAVRNKIYAIYRQVAADPERYTVSPEVVALVTDAVSNRKIAIKSEATPQKVEGSPIVATDIKNLTLTGRDTAGRLIAKKLEFLEAHPKALAAESLVNLGKIFGIMFDKSQIIQGQATEHVALMGTIHTNLTPEEALEAVLRSREVMQAEKHG